MSRYLLLLLAIALSLSASGCLLHKHAYTGGCCDSCSCFGAHP